MRVLVVLIVAAACSVPDKEPAQPDGGADAGVDVPEDTGAPETSITVAPPAFSPDGTARFEFTSDDPEARFECRVDDQEPVACTSPFARDLADGPHSFSVRAIDPVGNADDTPAEHVWSIDTAAPTTSFEKTPPSADNSTMVRFEFTSNEDNVTFECSLDGTAFRPCESGETFGPVSDGAHSFAVRAVDRAGNVDASPAIHAWNVDTSTPDTQLLSGPEGATSSTSASFSFVSPDAGAGATFQCALDGGPFSACTSPRSYTNLGMGEHTFAVRVRDAVGNLDPTPATRRWSVDITPPNTTIASGPSGVEPSASATFTFTANEPDVTFACALDGGAFGACTSPYSVMGLAQGPHTFAVRATDSAGHTDPSPATRAWTVDTIAPEIAITSGPASGSTSGSLVTFTFSVSEGSPTCSVDGATFTACTSPLDLMLAPGPHELRIRAADAAGNETTLVRAWTVVCSAPDATGALGLLHLDDPGQLQPNATGGPGATLGADETVEVADPTPGAGRYGGGLAFTAAEGDFVAWPLASPARTALALELWARPAGGLGTRELLATADGRISIRVAPANGNVRFTAVVVEAGEDVQTHVVSSPVADADAWHHVLVTISEPDLILWVDGVRRATDVALGTPLALDSIRLGGDTATAYTGALDEVWLGEPITSDAAAQARFCPP